MYVGMYIYTQHKKNILRSYEKSNSKPIFTSEEP